MISSQEYPIKISPDNPYRELVTAYIQALFDSDRPVATKLIIDAVESGTPIKDLYLHVFQVSQRELGRLWQNGIIGVAQEHYCTAATQVIMAQLYPYIFSTEKTGKRIVTTCVGGELHEIGVRMVSDFFEMGGWDTYYLGANAPVQSIIETIHKQDAHLVGISATMYFNVSKVKKLISTIKDETFNQDVKIMVGGYPFLIAEDLWKELGADAYAPDAEKALEVADRLFLTV